MDRDVTVRFYEIEQVGDGYSFADTIKALLLRPLAERQAGAGEGIVIRLEEARTARGVVFGDLTRVQTSNLPSHPTDTASEPLPVTQLGHHAAFCFDLASGIMALQFDIKMGVGRVCSYFSAFGDGSQFRHYAVLREDALERFERETPTKFTVRVANVHRFTETVEASTNFESAIKGFGDLFDAPTVEVSVSAKFSHGGLDKKTVLQTVKRYIGFKSEFEGVKAITAETAESADPFNFITALLKMSETLDLPDNDPTAGRDVRISFVRQCFDANRDYIRTRYVDAPA